MTISLYLPRQHYIEHVDNHSLILKRILEESKMSISYFDRYRKYHVEYVDIADALDDVYLWIESTGGTIIGVNER